MDSIKGFKMFNEATLERSIFNIAETDGVNTENRYVSFDFRDRITTGIYNTTVTELTISDDRIYTLDGRYVGTDRDALPHGIYIQNKQKFIK